MPDRDEELVHLRRLRDRVLAILQGAGLTPEDKLRAIERAFKDEGTVQPQPAQEVPDEEAEAEEARDRERLS